MTVVDSATRAGGCSCGALRYTMRGEPLFVHCCHCTWCQRESGSAFAVNVLIEAERIVMQRGEPAIVNTPSASGEGQKFARCPKCQVALWSTYAGAGDAIRFVRAGTLDWPHDISPDIHIFTTTRQPWVQLPAHVPAVPEYYDAETRWPADSLSRRNSLRS